MAKIKNKSGIKKIDLEDIILKENVRFDYQEIKELAYSIERDGLIQPVAITLENELIAGYRRYKAHEFLVSEGKPFNQIECIVKNGNLEIIQLTENIQRSNLNPIELENGLKKMINLGMTKQEIANRLNKRLTWVCDTLKACEIREKIKADTSDISSTAMSQLRTVNKEDLPEVIKEIKENGSTVQAVKNAINKDPFDRIKKEALKLKKAGYRLDEIIEIIEVILL